ncbi:MAG: outer membrane protein assembly factor BamD [Rhodospirillales bacterium]|nr:outer membrane protein assembly factor BamD [Rhodospirillales bacterium]MBO6787235.1 outer membrane protein assembly factor BamD [Rhodospirillales bacterium]
MVRVNRTLKVLTATILLAVSTAACTSDEEPEYVERPVSEIYNSAMNRMQDEYYRDAAKEFDEVERQHPYSIWATKAQLMAAYSYYQSNRYDDAIIALDRFTQLHPANRDVAYAYYLKALCYYEQISDVARDQKMTELALNSLNEVIKRFPDSEYARDAKIKVDLTYDHLAGKEMEIGRYYLTQKHYLAAINRFRTVVEKFETTTHVPEALHRLTEAYLALGVTSEARKTASVLGHNFPGSEWYSDSYQLFEGKPVSETEETPWYKIW